MYARRVVRGGIAVGVGALALTGCFRGDFLAQTCEQLPEGCAAATTGDASTGAPTTGAPSTGAAGSGITEAPPGIPLDGPVFRVSRLELIDPHLYFYISDQLCTDVDDTLSAAIGQELDSLETNILLAAEAYAPTAALQTFTFYRDADCSEGSEGISCVTDPLVPAAPFKASNVDEGACVADFDPLTLDDANLPLLSAPVAPCLKSPKIALDLSVVSGLPPIKLYLGQMLAQYSPDDVAPTRIEQGLLYGFITREDAQMLRYTVSGTEIPLWSVVRGGDANACTIPEGETSDVDAVVIDEGGDPRIGVFMYFNFEADLVTAYFAG